jgi:hypothetical protein
MSKDFFRRLVVLVSVLVSGLGLSLIFVVQTTPFVFLLLCAAPVAAVALVPRKYWLRITVFVFLIASVYGMGRIAAEMGRNMLYGSPLPQSGKHYVYELLLYAIYGSIGIVWWLRTRKTNSKFHV